LSGLVNSDLYRYSPQGKTWELLSVSGDVPTPRSDHAAVLDSKNDCMYILYGRGLKVTYYPDFLYRFHFRTLTWERLSASGRAPKPRSCHEAALVDQHPTLGVPVIFLFGGWNMRKYFRHLYMLRLDTLEWIKLAHYGRNEPRPRLCHSLTVAPDGARLLLFGGECFTREYLNDLMEFDIRLGAWQPLVQYSLQELPAPRHGHRIEMHGHHMYLFGGYDGLTFFGDVHRMDTRTQTWERVTAACGGICPPAITCHGMACFSESAITQHALRPRPLSLDPIPAAASASVDLFATEQSEAAPRMWHGLYCPPAEQRKVTMADSVRPLHPHECPCAGAGHRDDTTPVLSMFVLGGWRFESDGTDVRSAELFRCDVFADSEDCLDGSP
jgi:hypothetical protein